MVKVAWIGAVLVLLAVPAGSREQPAAPAQALTDQQIERFLQTARVVSSRAAGKGITNSLRATLSDGTLTHDAHIQTIDEYKQEFRGGTQREIDFRDKWQYNVAAYRIDRLLDLRLAPVSVDRSWQGLGAAFSWWVDDVLMDEETRRKKQVEPPEIECWSRQLWAQRMFDQLIDNVDRNLGNTLIDKTWRLWAIDHTRAFRTSREPRSPHGMLGIDRGVLQRLQSLTFEALKREVGKYLRDADIRAMLSRRDGIVAHFQKLGDSAVYNRRDPATGCPTGGPPAPSR